MKEIVCKMSGIVKWFPPNQLLFDNLNLTIAKYEQLLITGCSGSGKSSLIRMLAGDLVPDEGSVFMYKTSTVIYKKVGLIPTMTLLQHIALPLICQGYGRKESMRRAGDLLEQLDESSRAILRPDQMGSYERALISLGQALVQNTELIAADTFIDELAANEKQKILKLLFSLTKEKAFLMMSDTEMKNWPFNRRLHLRDKQITTNSTGKEDD